MSHTQIDDSIGLKAALAQAKKSASEGGIPIGSALVFTGKESGKPPEVLSASHNQRIQKGSAILHAEMATLEEAGRIKAAIYRECTMVSV